MPADLITLTEAAKIAGCNTSTLRYAIQRGEFPGAVKFGKTWAIPRDEFDKWNDEPGKHKPGRRRAE